MAKEVEGPGVWEGSGERGDCADRIFRGKNRIQMQGRRTDPPTKIRNVVTPCCYVDWPMGRTSNSCLTFALSMNNEISHQLSQGGGEGHF